MPSEIPTIIQTPSSLASEDSADKSICKICRRQFAKYTCPTCNTPYCSLTCFRSEVHSQCSEMFYKKEIEKGILSEPSKSSQERTQMLELLKRFEEESANEDLSLEENGDPSGLAQRFASVDLNTAPPDVLWSVLTPAEREKFTKALNDPSSELAQQLLSSEELQKNLREPWWTAPPLSDEDRFVDRSLYDDPPSMLTIPEAMLQPRPNQPLLVYNICSICIAYAFTIRHLGLSSLSSLSFEDSDFDQAQKLISQLLPFLVDRKSTVVFPNLSNLITDMWSRFDPDTISADLLSVLLRDAYQLMCPLHIVQKSATLSLGSSKTMLDAHPHQLLLLVLSDLGHLFALGFENPRTRQALRHVSHKLVFYGAHVATMPTPLLRSVANELEGKSEAFQAEAKQRETASVDQAPSRSKVGALGEDGYMLVQEL